HPHEGGDVLGAGGEHDEVGQRAEEREPVRLVDDELVGLRQHPARPDDGLELAAQRGFTVGGQGHHGCPEYTPVAMPAAAGLTRPSAAHARDAGPRRTRRTRGAGPRRRARAGSPRDGPWPAPGGPPAPSAPTGRAPWSRGSADPAAPGPPSRPGTPRRR